MELEWGKAVDRYAYYIVDIKEKVRLLLKNGPFPASFSLFSSFQYSWQPRTSGIVSDRSTNWATTTAHKVRILFVISFHTLDISRTAAASKLKSFTLVRQIGLTESGGERVKTSTQERPMA